MKGPQICYFSLAMRKENKVGGSGKPCSGTWVCIEDQEPSVYFLFNDRALSIGQQFAGCLYFFFVQMSKYIWKKGSTQSLNESNNNSKMCEAKIVLLDLDKIDEGLLWYLIAAATFMFYFINEKQPKICFKNDIVYFPL